MSENRDSYSPRTNYSVSRTTTNTSPAAAASNNQAGGVNVSQARTGTVLPDRNMKPAERRISMESYDPCIITTVK